MWISVERGKSLGGGRDPADNKSRGAFEVLFISRKMAGPVSRFEVEGPGSSDRSFSWSFAELAARDVEGRESSDRPSLPADDEVEGWGLSDVRF